MVVKLFTRHFTVPEFYEIKFWNCRNDEVKSAL